MTAILGGGGGGGGRRRPRRRGPPAHPSTHTTPPRWRSAVSVGWGGVGFVCKKQGGEGLLGGQSIQESARGWTRTELAGGSLNFFENRPLPFLSGPCNKRIK